MRPVLILALLLVAPLAAQARPASSPTVAACALKDARLPNRPRHVINVMDCLMPKSIVVKGTLAWSDCASAPAGDTCDTGTITVSFRSTASGFTYAPGLTGPESWGSWEVGSGQYAVKKILYWRGFGLPGTGTFHCKAETFDRQSNSKSVDFDRTVPLKDQAAAFAVVGGAIRVSTSLYPGYHGPYGHNADRLFLANACRLPTLRPSFESAAGLWPGRVVPVGSLSGASPVVRITGAQKHSILSPNGSWYGPRIDLAYSWSATIALRPAV